MSTCVATLWGASVVRRVGYNNTALVPVVVRRVARVASSRRPVGVTPFCCSSISEVAA